MEQPPDPSHTASHSQAVSSTIDLYFSLMEGYIGMKYDKKIGWYNIDTLKIEDKLPLKREEPYDLPTI